MSTTPHAFSVDDKDLDDAELWAVIDSAAASHSSSRSRKPLAIKHTSPQPHFRALTLYQSPKLSTSPRIEGDVKAAADGEVLQERSLNRIQNHNHNHHHRPQKIARSGASASSCVEESRIVVAKPLPLQRTPKTPVFSSPESGRVSVQEIVSPVSDTAASPVCSGKEERLHSLSGQFPSVALFKEFQNAAMEILEKGDYTTISGNAFIKKSGWRKIAFYFNISFEIRDKSIEFDDNRNVQRAEFVVRAHMQGGRFSDGWGSCERREKRFMKPNHDIPSTAETRAKSRACQDLLGIGEYRRGTS